MNAVPQVTTSPLASPATSLISEREVLAQPVRPAAPPHEVETLETIEVRATSMTLILEKIMACGGGHPHGGLND